MREAETASDAQKRPAVAVCICTCRRPEGLRKALGKLTEQTFDGPLSVFVVDNHPDREGEAVCAEMAASYPYPLSVAFEPKAGISHARNAVLTAALKSAVDFIAMIDDDEWPEPNWLDALLVKQVATGADVVGGPTVPAFEETPPDWVVKANMFKTSTLRLQFGTGNVLYKADMLRACEGDIFDARFGMSGGEDAEFARRMLARGKRFVACEEAVVQESIPVERMRRGYFIRRAIRDGNVQMIWDRNRKPEWYWEFVRPFLIVRKVLYAGEHLLFSVAQPWRLMRCVLDLCQVVGMAAGSLNLVYTFYASDRGERARLQWNPVRAAAPD